MPRGVYDHYKLRGRKNTKSSINMEKLWQDPEYRARQSASHKGHRQSKESIEKGIKSRKNNGRPWHSKEAREKLSEQKIGDKNPAKRPEVREKLRAAREDKTYEEIMGEEKAEETKKKQSESKEGHEVSEETREKIKEALEGRTFSSEHMRNISRSMKKLWQDPEFAKMMIKAQRRKPNNFEKRLDKFLQEILLKEYQINVKAEVMTLAGKCPDFVNVNGQKKIIEANGDWWHRPEITGRTKEEEEQQRIDLFAKEGYQTLIIWEHELKDIDKLTEKVLNFNKRS